MAATLNNLANACGDLGDHRKKKELLERALEINTAHFGPSHYEVGRRQRRGGGVCGGRPARCGGVVQRVSV